MNRISIKCVAAAGAVVPEYKTSGAAGADICAMLPESVIIRKGSSAVIPTGLSFSIPEGYEIQVRPRSGLAARSGVTVLNSPGTIDSDYRGEVKVILVNLGDADFEVRNGDRIAQIVVAPVVLGVFETADALDVTDRGAGGFGSTGR